MAQEEERIRQDWQSMWHYTNRGRYYSQVKAFLEQFNRVLVLLYDDFKTDPMAVTRKVCQFLEVDDRFQPKDTQTRYNATGIPRFKILNRIFLMKNPGQQALRKVGSFLLSEDRWVKLRENLRSSLYAKARMKPETRAYLQDLFREDILRLQELLHRDLGTWLRSEA